MGALKGSTIPQSYFQVGNKVRFSIEGKQWIKPKNPDRIGRVKRLSNDGRVIVIWDGTTTEASYTPNFLYRIEI
jgi:hypothetical protein